MPEQGPAQDGQRKLAGKYESVDDLERGYQESSTEAMRLKSQLDAIAAENRALKLAGQQRQESDPDLAALEEAGIDVAALNRFIQRNASTAASGSVQEALMPLMNAAQAMQRIPPELQVKAQQILAKNADVSETYQLLVSKSPERAADYLTREVRFHDAEAGMKEEDGRVKAERAERRRDAALPNAQSMGRGDDMENAEAAEQEAAKRKALLERAQRAGGINKAIASEFFRGKLKVIDRLDEPPRTIS